MSDAPVGFGIPVENRGGWFNMRCWNGLSKDQQRQLVDVGNLPLGYLARGRYKRGAEVAVETMDDVAPGPRFYCRTCAVAFLRGGAKV